MPADVSFVLDQGNQILQIIGEFWSLIYGDVDGIRAIVRARAEADLQSRQDLLALSSSAGVATTPLYRTIRWLPVPIVLSKRLPDNRLSYQSDDALGPAATGFISTKTWDYQLPANLKLAPVIVDRIINPSLIMTQDVDYHLDQTMGAIRFRDDPLTNPLLRHLVTPGASGNAIDISSILWAFEAAVDASWLDQQHASAIGLSLGSSESARSVITAARAAIILGPTRASLFQSLSGLCGAPLVINTGEVVEYVGYDLDRLLVITDQNVYTCGYSANSLVVVGQVLNSGDPVCDAFQVIDLSHGAPSQLTSLTVPSSLFQLPLYGPLTWNNSNTPVVVTTVGGRTKVIWALGGNPTDVTNFWNLVHSNGTAVSAKSLAQLMDTRPKPQTTDPDVNSLPTVINPLDWLCRNVLGYSAIVIKIRPASFGPTALGQGLINTILRLVMPPQQTAIIITI